MTPQKVVRHKRTGNPLSLAAEALPLPGKSSGHGMRASIGATRVGQRTDTDRRQEYLEPTLRLVDFKPRFRRRYQSFSGEIYYEKAQDRRPKGRGVPGEMTNNPMNMMFEWMKVASSYNRMTLSAGEVIARRMMMMASGGMTGPDAMGMMMEKATIFATASERAAVAAASGADPVRITAAALKPYSTKTQSNVRKLRR